MDRVRSSGRAGTQRETDTIRRRTRKLLAPLSRFITELEDVGRVVVFGGAPRDLYQTTPSQFSRDVDLVVEGDAQELEAVCKRMRYETTRFGGLRIQLPGRTVDVWALSRTWAISQGLVRSRGVEGLLDSTYFSVDSIAYDLRSGRLCTRPDYFSMRAQRRVSLVLPQNPNPKGALVRTLRLVSVQGARIDWSLAAHTQELLVAHEPWLSGDGALSLANAGVGDLATLRKALERYLVEGMVEQPFRFDGASGRRSGNTHEAIQEELPLPW